MIFDTDVLIWFFRGNRRAADLIATQNSPEMSIVSLMELFQGARDRAELRIIRRFLQEHGFHVIPLNEPISHVAATLMEEHALSGGLQVADALIAATARETGSPLATANVRHFRSIAGLDLKVFHPTAR
ncbi:MAG TPA: type II toxin-antitoxin system VapC family toxin [Bryobacteraceae bacterium]|nr:type II toxin-antitoxin system VapC family toxin [Bryobacteraceae bacterium]